MLPIQSVSARTLHRRLRDRAVTRLDDERLIRSFPRVLDALRGHRLPIAPRAIGSLDGALLEAPNHG